MKMTVKKQRKQPPQQKRIKKSIPTVPFTSEEVYLLIERQASEELYNRLRVWKASKEYAFIKSLSNLMVLNNQPGHNRKLSKQERELRNQYFNWLSSSSLESDKFKSLDNVRLRQNNIVIRQKVKEQQEEDEEDYHKDTLTHSGIL
jgi:hypothetical protein